MESFGEARPESVAAEFAGIASQYVGLWRECGPFADGDAAADVLPIFVVQLPGAFGSLQVTGLASRQVKIEIRLHRCQQVAVRVAVGIAPNRCGVFPRQPIKPVVLLKVALADQQIFQIGDKAPPLSASSCAGGCRDSAKSLWGLSAPADQASSSPESSVGRSADLSDRR